MTPLLIFTSEIATWIPKKRKKSASDEKDPEDDMFQLEKEGK
jgi:hypothetical protein